MTAPALSPQRSAPSALKPPGFFTGFAALYRREISQSFRSPLAYVFIAVFLLALGTFTFEFGQWFATNSVDLAPFFAFHPWLYVVFMPALAMRAWADEIKAGTLELMFSLPVSVPAMVLAKFCALWTMAALALLLSLPMWLSAAWLGPADHAAIALGYAMSLLLAGAYLAIGMAASALSSAQVVAFVGAGLVAFIFTAAGLPVVGRGLTEGLGPDVAAAVARLSLLTQFEAAQRGVIDLRAVVQVLLVIALGLTLSGLWISRRRGG